MKEGPEAAEELELEEAEEVFLPPHFFICCWQDDAANDGIVIVDLVKVYY